MCVTLKHHHQKACEYHNEFCLQRKDNNKEKKGERKGNENLF